MKKRIAIVLAVLLLAATSLYASGDFGQCAGDCASEEGICMANCQGDGECMNNCAAAHGRCMSRCN